MVEKIKAYYRGERITNAILMSYGAAATITGVVFHWYTDSRMSLGLMYGLGLIGTIQIIIGTVRIWRSFRLYDQSVQSLDTGNAYLTKEEHKRLTFLDKRFQKMRAILTIVFLISFGIIVICAMMDAKRFLLGSGAAITLHAAVLLVFDLFSQFRTREYIYQIEKLD